MQINYLKYRRSYRAFSKNGSCCWFCMFGRFLHFKTVLWYVLNVSLNLRTTTWTLMWLFLSSVWNCHTKGLIFSVFSFHTWIDSSNLHMKKASERRNNFPLTYFFSKCSTRVIKLRRQLRSMFISSLYTLLYH